MFPLGDLTALTALEQQEKSCLYSEGEKKLSEILHAAAAANQTELEFVVLLIWLHYNKIISTLNQNKWGESD